MKKLAFVMFSVLLAGCGHSSEGEKTPKSKEVQGEVKKEKAEKAVNKEEPADTKAKEDISGKPVLAYLKEEKTNGDIKGIGMDPETGKKVMAITQEMQRSIAANKAWFAEYTQKNMKEGEALPYSPKFGITEKEYQLLLDSQNNSEMIKKGETSVEIKRQGDKLTVTAPNSSFKTAVFDLKANTVKTKYGVLSYKGKIEASSEQAITGPWSGEAWKFEDGNVKTMQDAQNMDENSYIKSVNFYVGKLQETGETLIYFTYRELKDMKKSQEEEFIVLK
ncbi:hypothetical protein SAMN05443252_102417 [Bacillus sp. OV322]|uniref:hypothetical protein n=1 Tax=Bacillus sp. OV322 TaxID=1882764 RepID=UPI0008E2BEF8|nr:hypothetical protein [Bacillus sp. OV322]SFC25359.1 hypothetical protein SAMN05443252_102417 [Bacillus sp. OV322]